MGLWLRSGPDRERLAAPSWLRRRGEESVDWMSRVGLRPLVRQQFVDAVVRVAGKPLEKVTQVGP